MATIYKKFETGLLIVGVLLSVYLLRPAITTGIGISAPDEYIGYSAVQHILTPLGLYIFLSTLLFVTSISLMTITKRPLLVSVIPILVFFIHSTSVGSALVPLILLLVLLPTILIFVAYILVRSKIFGFRREIINMLTIILWALFSIVIIYFTFNPISIGIKLPTLPF